MIAILIIVAAMAADQYLNFGFYMDSTLAMLHQIQRSFGF